ncbi:ABC transporter permease [Paludibaculum fermentans]|uniref:ABC transporter permease n=1 Tax=Paludibaculum fermentans TaxID=1473598 RepID=A0A7S7NS39_PALFE|nr:ABC transporter permease [Paludibaculum fermentans]QOY88767.1 ABC transporter permease [Paludibaculum fermentans]
MHIRNIVMRYFWNEFGSAVRLLRNRPAFSALVVATLALGIAANTTVFAWVDSLLLRPIPGVVNPGELLALEAASPTNPRIGQLQHPDFRDFQRQMTSAAGVIASHISFFTVGPVDHPRRVLGQVVSANYFDVLGVKPALGRMLLTAEDRDEKGAYAVAVISHRFWLSYFRGDPGVVGQSARVNGHQYVIVGVAPANFAGTYGGVAFDVWIPLSRIVEAGALNTWAASDRNARFLDVIIRRKSDASLTRVRAEAAVVGTRIAAAFPDTHRGIGATLVPMADATSGLQASLGSPLRLLMGVCALVLLIACANVANLLMARSVSRQREFGIRIALGAGRTALLRQIFFEVLVLAGAGAVVGVLLAQWLGESLFQVMPIFDSTLREAIEPLLQPEPRPIVLAFSALVAILAAFCSTILPALYAARVDVNESLKDGSRNGTSGVRTHRARSVLVVAEVALASMALVGAGLAVNAFQKLSRARLGFEPRNVITAQFHLSTNGYSLKKERAFSQQLSARLQSAPGIEQVAYANSIPLSIMGSASDRIRVPGTEKSQGVVSVYATAVSPGYFDLLKIALLEGRDFAAQDDATHPRVVIVNQTLAQRFFPGLNAIGRKLRVNDDDCTVIGIAQDSKIRSPREGPTPAVFASFGQSFYSGHNNFLFIRTRDFEAARETLRREVQAMDTNRALYEPSTLAEQTQAGLFGERVAAAMLSALALLALLLAAVGLYSVMAYAVSERTREIGVRMALGAQRRQVFAMVLNNALALTLTGLIAGVAAAIAAARVVSSTVEAGLDFAGPEVYAIAGLLVLLVTLLSTCLPARRATRIDPMSALRAE